MNIETIKRVLADAQRNERHQNVAETRYWCGQYKQIATEAVRALAEAEKQEPFGYFKYAPHFDAWVQNRDSNEGVAFYTLPQPKREWVGLTEREIDEAYLKETDMSLDIPWIFQFGRSLEAKLKEKNHAG